MTTEEHLTAARMLGDNARVLKSYRDPDIDMIVMCITMAVHHARMAQHCERCEGDGVTAQSPERGGKCLECGGLGWHPRAGR